MRFINRYVAAAGAVGAMTAATAAMAQQGATTVVSREYEQPTFSAAAIGIAPATAATDVLTIYGVAGKVVRVLEMGCDGTATANGNNVFQIVKRRSADSGGTASTLTAVSYDSNDSASAAVLAYTANPTVGTLTGIISAGRISLSNNATITMAAVPVLASFGNGLAKPVTLRGTAEGLAWSGNGTTFPAGTALNCRVTWTEAPG